MIVLSWFLKSVSVQQISLLIISDAIWGRNAHFSFMLWKYQILRRKNQMRNKEKITNQDFLLYFPLSLLTDVQICASKMFPRQSLLNHSKTKKLYYIQKIIIIFMKHTKRRLHFSVVVFLFYSFKPVHNSFAS